MTSFHRGIGLRQNWTVISAQPRKLTFSSRTHPPPSTLHPLQTETQECLLWQMMHRVTTPTESCTKNSSQEKLTRQTWKARTRPRVLMPRAAFSADKKLPARHALVWRPSTWPVCWYLQVHDTRQTLWGFLCVNMNTFTWFSTLEDTRSGTGFLTFPFTSWAYDTLSCYHGNSSGNATGASINRRGGVVSQTSSGCRRPDYSAFWIIVALLSELSFVSSQPSLTFHLHFVRFHGALTPRLLFRRPQES